MTLKSDMVRDGIISNISKSISISDIIKWKSNTNIDNISNNNDILYILDWEKIDQIDRYLFE